MKSRKKPSKSNKSSDQYSDRSNDRSSRPKGRIRKLYDEGKIGQARKEFVIQALRKASYRWPGRNIALQKARIEKGRYECARCNDVLRTKETKKDHVAPVVDPRLGFISWDHYIMRLLVPETGFQILCKICHAAKTKLEAAIRKEVKKNAKVD